MTSAYVLEISVAPGSARHAEGHAYGEFAAIEARWTGALGIGSEAGADAFIVGLVFQAATLALWVVERGRVSSVIDLRGYLTMWFDDGRVARLSDASALASLHADFNRDPSQRVRFVLDPGFVAAVPRISGRRLGEGEVLEAEVSDEMLERVPASYFVSGVEIEYGSWDLEDGSSLDEEAD